MRETIKVTVLSPMLIGAFVGLMHWLVQDCRHAHLHSWVLLMALSIFVWGPFIFAPYVRAKWGGGQ